jgi:hypothetical protein
MSIRVLNVELRVCIRLRCFCYPESDGGALTGSSISLLGGILGDSPCKPGTTVDAFGLAPATRAFLVAPCLGFGTLLARDWRPTLAGLEAAVVPRSVEKWMHRSFVMIQELSKANVRLVWLESMADTVLTAPGTAEDSLCTKWACLDRLLSEKTNLVALAEPRTG